MNISKNPVGDKMKVSKAGRMKLHRSGNGFMTMTTEKEDNMVGWNAYDDSLETVFENGKIIKQYTFDEVRKTAHSKRNYDTLKSIQS